MEGKSKMTSGSGERMTPEEVTVFAHKVEDWSRGLTSKEQTFLAEIITRAVNAETGDVQGYDLQHKHIAGVKYEDITINTAPLPNPAPLAPLSSSALTINFAKIYP